MRLNSIRTRTLAVLILICVAIVFILGGLWLYTTSQNIRSSVFSADAHDSKIISEYVRVYLDSVATPVEIISTDSETAGAIREKDMTQMKKVFQDLESSTPQDDIAFIVDRDGRLLYSTCSTASAPMGPETEEILVESANSSFVTDIFYSSVFKRYVFAVVSPIRDNGTVIGYIYDEINPSDLHAFLVREKHHLVYHLILVDSEGRVILHSDRSITEQHPDLSSYLPVKKALQGESGVMDDPGVFDCKPCISAYHPVSDTGWGLVVATKADVPYRQLEGYLLRIVGVCALFILALTVFGYFASRYLIDPVERLSATMQLVSGGDYGVSLRAARDDEFGDLERAFNSLVSEIKVRDDRIRSEKDRSEFYLDLISHDINNMNHMGMGYLEMAIGDLKGTVGKVDLELLDKAYDSLKNSSGLIDNVRKIQKLHTGRLAPEVVDMGQMLSEVEKKYAHFPGRVITINYTPVTGCRVMACSLFREVLGNIVGNAIKHSDPPRPLTISMSLVRVEAGGRDYCKVSIEDDGPGVPDAMKEAIFSRFQRGETAARGRGLGLYIVRMLVEEYGGSVHVEDRVPGDYARGARFVILMPAADN